MYLKCRRTRLNLSNIFECCQSHSCDCNTSCMPLRAFGTNVYSYSHINSFDFDDQTHGDCDLKKKREVCGHYSRIHAYYVNSTQRSNERNTLFVCLLLNKDHAYYMNHKREEIIFVRFSHLLITICTPSAGT